MRKIILALVVIGLMSCSVLPPMKVDVNYNPETQARIRLGAGTLAYLNTSCYKKGIFSIQGDSIGFSNYALLSKKNKIGMPKSKYTRSSYNVFEEMLVAGQPIMALARYQSTAGNYTSSCASPYVTFIPEAGKDYQLELNFDGRTCSLEAI